MSGARWLAPPVARRRLRAAEALPAGARPGKSRRAEPGRLQPARPARLGTPVEFRGGARSPAALDFPMLVFRTGRVPVRWSLEDSMSHVSLCRSYSSLRSSLAFALAFLAGACGGTPRDNGRPATSIEVEALRSELFLAGVEPLPEPPAVSDELFALGRALFFDKILSGNQDVSCATCHLPQFATGDGRTLADGVHGLGLGPNRGGGAIVPRNSPALFALHLKHDLFWDGRVRDDGITLRVPAAVRIDESMRAAFLPGLEAVAAQAMLPPVSREEMRGVRGENPIADLDDGYNSPGGNPEGTTQVWQELTERLLDTPGYVQLLRAAYPGVALQDFSFAHVGNAIAAFEVRAFAGTDSPFQRFVRGDDTALTGNQVRGALVFYGVGCGSCHSGALLTDQGHHNTGLPQIGPGVNGLTGTGQPFGPGDAIPTNPALIGPDFGHENATGLFADRYTFRTPSLLNVELTAPYGHAGQFARLRDMVAHYEDVAFSNLNYDIQSNVSDPRLAGARVPNTDAVLATLDPRLETPRDLDVRAVLDFLHALTDPGARRLAELVPASVPSGLPVF